MDEPGLESGEHLAPARRSYGDRATDSRRGAFVHRYGSILISLLAAVVAIVTANNASAHDAKEALRRVDAVERDVKDVRVSLANLPTKESIEDLRQVLSRVQDQMDWLIRREADRPLQARR